MNAPVRRVAIALVVLFCLLMLNANYVQVIRADDLRADPSNSRILLSEYERQRGSIVVNGQPVAHSQETDDRLKYLRTYPKGKVYAPVTGYYSLVYGADGMERAENTILSGDDDQLFTSRLRDLFTGRDPKGGNVVLTIDRRAQETAYNAMGDRVGSVVALDPRSGEILAMVSTPSYDPSVLSSHDPASIRKNWNAFEQASPDPMINRAIRERYTPGSTFKVVISAAALRDGVQPEDRIAAPTTLTLPGTRTDLPNFEGERCGGDGRTDTFKHALTMSCNTAFAQLGIDLGQDKVREQAEAFGIDDEGFEMPLRVVPSTLGDIPDDAKLALSSIGENEVQITPLEGAMIAGAVANDGVLMRPHLVKEIQAPDLTTLEETEDTEIGRAMSSDDADKLTDMMVSVVEGSDGTGRRARVDGVTVAGKTGTAEHLEGAPTHAWFIGFAPAENPTVAVAVLLERAGETGGRAAAPIASEVISAVLRSQGGG